MPNTLTVGPELVMGELHFYRSSSGPSLKKFGPVLGLSVPGPRIAHHYRECYGFKSGKALPHVPDLVSFGKDFYDMIKQIEFGQNQNEL